MKAPFWMLCGPNFVTLQLHDSRSPYWPPRQPIIPVNIMKCRSIWPCSRLLRCAKANIDKPQHSRDAGQKFRLHYLYLCMWPLWLHCLQYRLVSLTRHSLGLITCPFASTGTLTSHSVLPIWIFGFQGHCLQFALAWQIQSKLVSIKQHRGTRARIKMDFLWC